MREIQLQKNTPYNATGRQQKQDSDKKTKKHKVYNTE